MTALGTELENRGSTKNSRKSHDYKKEWMQSIKTSSGQIITNRKNILLTATDFYKNLYSENQTTDPIDISSKASPPPTLEFLPSEIENAFSRLKKNKSPGEDGITTDMIIAMMEPLTLHLTKLFNTILTKEEIPEDWTHSIITLIYKKGDPKLIDNYRPISLLPVLYKLFSSLILFRISKSLDEQQPREQAGFRKGYSTIDHIFTLSQCIEKCKEYNKPIYLAFVDYTKAFDSIIQMHLWKSLKEQGIDNKIIRILKLIYDDCNAKIKLENIGPPFQIERGVKQGDPISPKLFTALLESMFRKLHWDNYGININGENLTHLRFADDIVILSNSHQELQLMLHSLDCESKKVGLHMNMSKTKIMTNDDPIPITINLSTIEYVHEYIYLGQLISLDDLTEKEINRRIAISWKKYWANKDIFKNKKIPIPLKKKLYDSTILPCLLYGCQTWALTKKQINKLSVFQRATERSILGIRINDRVKNSEIRKKTSLIDAATMFCKLKWKWAGHLARSNDGRWSERVLHWYPRDGVRTRGRPRVRWRDDIEEVAHSTWTRDAQHRRRWQIMEEAFTRHWVPNQ